MQPTDGSVPLAILIFGRDLGLSISAFYFRFISLPKPVRQLCLAFAYNEADPSPLL